MFGSRWVVGGGALLVAGIALYVLLHGGGGPSHPDSRNPERSSGHAELRDPALDDIDAKSRKAMRDLLRDAD